MMKVISNMWCTTCGDYTDHNCGICLKCRSREEKEMSITISSIGSGDIGGSSRDPLLVEREKSHGDFITTAKISQNLKSTIHYHNSSVSSAQKEALEMIATKIARILCGDPFEKDHWNDIAGYAHLGAESCPDEKK
jgi:Domain of unknown function (DUF6378)